MHSLRLPLILATLGACAQPRPARAPEAQTPAITGRLFAYTGSPPPPGARYRVGLRQIAFTQACAGDGPTTWTDSAGYFRLPAWAPTPASTAASGPPRPVLCVNAAQNDPAAPRIPAHTLPLQTGGVHLRCYIHGDAGSPACEEVRTAAALR